MDIKSLMIGDWIKIKTYGVSDKFERTEAYIYAKVVEIGSGLITVEHNNDIKEPYRICENTEIEPIPLTPEILEKNGFRIIFEGELHTTYFQDIEFFHVEIKIDCINYIKLSMLNGLGYNITIECKFVHQLQQALRLCDTSKEIEL